MNDRAAKLRALLEVRDGMIIPGCHDALGARLVEQHRAGNSVAGVY